MPEEQEQHIILTLTLTRSAVEMIIILGAGDFGAGFERLLDVGFEELKNHPPAPGKLQ